MSSARGGEVLELRGPPRRLTAVLPVALPAHGGVRVQLARRGAKAGERADFVARVTPFGDAATEIRLQLPRDLPPGSYDGIASIGGSEQKVHLEVEARVRLRVHPRESRVVVPADRRAEIRVQVANQGNAPVEIPRVAAFGVFELGGLDTAIGQTLRAELKQGERRVDRLMDELVERHGGLVRVGVTKGAGELLPGASAEVTATLEIPAGLTAGHSYSGVWPLANVNHRVVITAAANTGTGRREV